MKIIQRKLIIFLILFLLNVIVVKAELIDVSVITLTEQVPPGGEALFTVRIYNNQIREDIFKISADEKSVAPFSEFAETVIVNPSQIAVHARSIAEIKVSIRVLDTAPPNKNHITKMLVKSLLNPNIQKEFELTSFVFSARELIGIEPKVPEKIIPGKEIPFKINFQNKGNILLEDLDVYLSSEIFTTTAKLNFLPYQTITKEFVLNISPITPPGEYILNIRVYKEQELRGITSAALNILQNPDIRETTNVEKGFFGLNKKTTIIKTNEGNSAVDDYEMWSVSWFSKIFTHTNPKGNIVIINDKKYLEWRFIVEPQQTYTVEIRKDYRPLVIVIVVILLFIGIVLYWLSKGVSIKKRGFIIKDEREGLAEAKILLHVRNTADDPVANVRVIDFLPNIIKPSQEFGTLKPNKIEKGASGLRFIWDLPLLDVGEERVISYKVIPKLHIVGKMILPSALAQYKNKRGLLLNLTSNKLTLLTKKEE